MMTRFSMRAGAVAVAAALLAACGSDDSGGSSGGQADAGEPQSGGTASIVQLLEARSLEPAVLGNLAATNALVGNSLYGQLLRVSQSGEIEYGLAEDLSTSDGGTTWKLTLREGLTFSDGTPFDAAAVKVNWERTATMGSYSRGPAGFVATMTPNGQTLDFTLTRPIAPFYEVVSSEALNWIASPQALEAGPAEFDANPIGAGPFVLESWQRGGEMVLVRNENYYDSPRPYLDELVLTVNGDANQQFSTLAAGQVDGVVSTSPDQLPIALDQGANAATQELGHSLLLAMNARMAPFDDPRVRQAVFQAVDREAVNAAAYQGEGTVPDTLFAQEEYDGDATLPEHDPEAAQEMFDELAAEGNPVEFLITTLQSTQSRRVAEAVQAQLMQFDNVSVDLEVLDQSASLAKYNARTFQMTTGLLRVGPVDLYTNLHSESAGNVAGVFDPELDEALEAVLTATDEQAQVEARQRVAERYTELVPHLTYIRAPYALVYDDRLQGVELYSTSSPRTDTLWVAE